MTTTESLDMIHIFYGIRKMYMQVWKAAEKMFSGGVPALEVFDWCKHEYVENDAFLESVIEDFKQVYSAQSEQQWISCSKRLPEDLEEVNVTWVNHDPEPYYNFVKDKPFTATAVYYKEKWYWYSSTCADLLAEYGRNPNQEIDDGIEIIAWMPMPEPYKERREEHD